MRCLQIVCAAVLMLACSTIAAAAKEPDAAVNRTTLSQMGFGNARRISDAEGFAVRGKGSFAIVWGTGYGPIVRQHFAAGSSHVVTPAGSFSGGGSFAFAR
jgi:hypothetical protein